MAQSRVGPVRRGSLRSEAVTKASARWQYRPDEAAVGRER